MATSLEQIDAFIGQGNPLAQAGGARTLLRATGGNLEGAAFLAALAKKESSFGATAGKFRNNFWGYGVHLGPSVYTSPSVEAGARKVWRGLNSGLYRGAGLTTPGPIIAKYAPPSENDTSLYQQQVSADFRRLGLDPSTDIFAGRRVAAQPGASIAPGARPAQAAQGGLRLTPQSLAAVRQYARQSEADVLQGKAPSSAVPVGARLRTTGAPPAARRQVAFSAMEDVGRPADPSEAQVVNAAKANLGTPYSWGGGTPAGPSRGFAQGANTIGFDCSSLVQNAWAKVGVKLPRTTYDQIKVGSAVPSLKAARPGDLLFPSTGHVQMYVGNGKVIEAPRTGGQVQIVPVRSSYIAIRRPA